MKKYFYCKSYQNFLIALKFKATGDAIVILTSEPDIIKTCQELEISFITFTHYRYQYIANNLNIVEKEIDILCKNICPGLLYFSHTQYDVFCFLLMQHYARFYDQVKFIDHELELNKYTFSLLSPLDYKTFSYKRKISRYFNVELTLREHSKKPVIAIGNSFLTKNGIEVVKIRHKFFDEIYEGALQHQINLLPMNNLFLSQKMEDIVDNHTDLNEINNYISTNSIPVKLHPYFKNQNNHFSNCLTVPAHYPAELLFGNIKGSVISIASLALITASRFPTIKSISLLNLIKLKDVKLEMKIRELLTSESMNKILFPHSLPELGELLSKE